MMSRSYSNTSECFLKDYVAKAIAILRTFARKFSSVFFETFYHCKMINQEVRNVKKWGSPTSSWREHAWMSTLNLKKNRSLLAKKA